MQLKSESIWVIIGKVLSSLLTVFTLIWVLIQIADHFSSDKTGKIAATVKSNSYIVPKLISEKIIKSLPTELYDTLNRLLPPSNLKNPVSNFNLETYLWNKFHATGYSNFKTYTNFFTLNINNPSAKTVESLNVDISHEGFYQLISQDDSEKESFYSHNIFIGDLRPQNKAILNFWSDFPIGLMDVKINYKDGYVRPESVNEVNGFGSWLTLFIIVAFTVIFIWITFLILKNRWLTFSKSKNCFYILNKASNKAITVPGSSERDKELIQVSRLDSGNNQIFELQNYGNLYCIIAKHSGKCLDINKELIRGETPIIQNTFKTLSSQLWKIQQNSDGSYFILQSNGNCLEADSMEVHQDGGRVLDHYRMEDGKNEHQKWLLVPILN